MVKVVKHIAVIVTRVLAMVSFLAGIENAEKKCKFARAAELKMAYIKDISDESLVYCINTPGINKDNRVTAL